MVGLLFLVIEVRLRMKLKSANKRLMEAPTIEDRNLNSRTRRASSRFIQVTRRTRSPGPMSLKDGGEKLQGSQLQGMRQAPRRLNDTMLMT